MMASKSYLVFFIKKTSGGNQNIVLKINLISNHRDQLCKYSRLMETLSGQMTWSL